MTRLWYGKCEMLPLGQAITQASPLSSRCKWAMTATRAEMTTLSSKRLSLRDRWLRTKKWWHPNLRKPVTWTASRGIDHSNSSQGIIWMLEVIWWPVVSLLGESLRANWGSFRAMRDNSSLFSHITSKWNSRCTIERLRLRKLLTLQK
jgi:hypothetical protein